MTPTATELPLIETAMASDEPAVAALIVRARDALTPVYPIGGGTSLDYGPHPAQPGFGLCLSCMNRVLDHPADDLTITVEAGLSLAALNRHLATKRQWLPIDAPQSARATAGGIVATNAYGPRRYARGTVGDYLIGFRAIDGCGTAFVGGGRVVKNAAGYNLPRLMIGGLGTLGVLTQLTFMVRPMPTHSALVICDLSSFQKTECLLTTLARSRTTPTIVELFAGPARPTCPLPAMPDTAAARLVVGYDGSAAEVQGMANGLCGEWQAQGADGLTTIAGARMDAVWSWLSESPALLQINVLPGRLVEVAEKIVAHLPAAPLQAHAGNGVIRVYPPTVAAMEFQAELARLVPLTLRPIAEEAGGNLVVLAAAAGINLSSAEIWGPPRPGAALMRSIQRRFDPAGILNPGRFGW
jgi:glycolate oxidase FAD binding subunit